MALDKAEKVFEKYAFAWSTVGTAVAVGAAAVAIGKFVDAMIDWFKDWNIKRKSKKYYEKMIEANPSLQEEDPAVVAKYWASLYHWSPFMAQDPLAAGAYIKQSISRADPFGGPPIDTFNTLSLISKNIRQAKRKGEDDYSTVSRGVGQSVITQPLK